METIFNELHALLESKNKININNLKSGIIKVYILYDTIFNHICCSDSSLKNIIFKDFIPKTVNDLITIFNMFPNDMDIFEPIMQFYINNGKDIGLYCSNNIFLINKVFIDLFKLNNNYFTVVEFLRKFYQKMLENLNKKDGNYLEQNKYMLEHFFLVIKYFIGHIIKESTFDLRFVTEIIYFSNMINDVFPLLYIPVEEGENIKKIINTIIEVFEFLINVINILVKNGNNEDLIIDIKISLIIKCIASLFTENIIKYISLNLPDNNYKKIIEQIIKSTWLLLNVKKFDFHSCKELCLLYCQIILFDCDKFYEYFEQCLEMKGIFNQYKKENNFKNIHDYIFLYKDDKSAIYTFINEILLIVYEGKSPDCLEYFLIVYIEKREHKIKQIFI